MLEAVTDGLIQVETDFLQYAESYYFLEEGVRTVAGRDPPRAEDDRSRN